MCEKYIKNGKVAILISPGYGSGWSTNNDDALAYDKRVVEFFLNHKDDKEYMKMISSIYDCPEQLMAKEYFESLGYESVYFGGFKNIVIKWLPVGTKFRITEYDGSESIETENDIKWIIA